MQELTLLIQRMESGDAKAAGELLPLVYTELRKLAAARLARENAGHTLQATALVHEAYLRLVGDEDAQKWDGRGHFFAAAAEAMRRILVESARRRNSLKRGGDMSRESLDDRIASPMPAEELLDLDEALKRLEEKDPVKAQLVKLRYFAGLTQEEAGRALGISHNTADKYWAYARAWLFREMKK